MKKETEVAIANIERALATIVATKQDHIVLEQNLEHIKKELSSCGACKREEELKELVKGE
jgi:hypothetical protein